jgi:membrane protease YdiL (CAAX protease family)
VPLRVAIGFTLLALVAANIVANRVAPGWGAVVVLALVGVLAAIAKAAGLTVDELGLARRTWGNGLRWGAGAAAVVAAGYLVALAVPAVRDAVTSAEEASWGDVLLQSLVVIPLGTVLGEEFAFRGVLWSLLRRAGGRWSATLVSSALFALWHVLPPWAAVPPTTSSPAPSTAAMVTPCWWRSPSGSPGWPGSCSASSGCAAGACWHPSSCIGR